MMRGLRRGEGVRREVQSEHYNQRRVVIMSERIIIIINQFTWARFTLGTGGTPLYGQARVLDSGRH